MTVASSPGGMVCAGGLATGMIDGAGWLGGLLPIPRLIGKRFAALWSGVGYLLPELAGEPCARVSVSRYRETADFLPIIGEAEPGSGCIFALPSGAAGFIQSEICSHLAADIALSGTGMSDAAMFSPARRSLVR